MVFAKKDVPYVEITHCLYIKGAYVIFLLEGQRPFMNMGCEQLKLWQKGWVIILYDLFPMPGINKKLICRVSEHLCQSGIMGQISHNPLSGLFVNPKPVFDFLN